MGSPTQTITQNGESTAIIAMKTDGSVVVWQLVSMRPCQTVQTGQLIRQFVMVVGSDDHVGESGCVTHGPDSDHNIKIRLSTGEESRYIKARDCEESCDLDLQNYDASCILIYTWACWDLKKSG